MAYIPPPTDTTPSTINITAQDVGSTTATTNANAQSVRTGSPTANSTALFTLSSWKTASVQATGTWTGTLLIEGSFDNGVTYFQKAVKQIGTAYVANNFTGNFGGTVNVATLTHLAVRSTATWTGTATVTVRESANDNGIYIHNGLTIQDATIQTNKLTVKSASTAPVATDPAVVVTESPNSPGTKITNGTSTAAISVTGSLNTSIDPSYTFFDSFDDSVIDVTNRWTSGGTVPPTQNGNILVNPGATANATSALVSQPTFVSTSGVNLGIFIKLEATTIALGNYRFWGFGTAPSGVGTAAAPIQDGYGFEVDTSGILRASVYATGTRVFTQSLTVPTDGAAHLYVIAVGPGTVFFYRDTFVTPAASTQITPTVQTLPFRIVSLNSASVTGTPTLAGAAAGVADYTHPAQGISDGTYAWRRATVSATGTLSVQDTSATPAGANIIGKVGIDQTTPGTTNLVAVSSISTSIVPGTAATNLGKAEDAASASGDTGVGVLGVRNDTLAAQTSASGDYGFHALDQAGILITAGAPRALKVTPTVVTITSSTTETTVLAAVASTFLDVYGITFNNTSATATKVTLRDATAGTVRWTGMVPPTDMRGFMLPVDSAIPQTTVNNNWSVQCGTSVASLEVTLFAVKRV